MIKSKKQMFIVIAIFAFIIIIGGTTYAWFNYRREGAEQRLIAGNIYLTFNENNDGINLTNIFPETKEEARSRNDNYLTFDITGINESNKTLYYEIDINHGSDKASPYERFADEDLRFDLVELDSNGDEVKYLLNAVSYDELINKRIWADEIASGSSTEVSRKYKLRMWLSEDVLISDSDPNNNYLATEYKNHYANIRLTVIGDFNEKYLGFQKVQKAILNKESQGGTCSNITYEEDGIIYFSGTNDCVDMNYVWYSGKLWRITAIYPDGAMKLVTENNITTIAFNESLQTNFYTDENITSYMYQWLNEDFYDTIYNPTRIIDTSKEWNATNSNASSVSEICNKLSETNMVSANVGLLNSYDFYNSYRCKNSSTCAGTSYSLGYLDNGDNWWLLNPFDTSDVWYVTYYGEGYNTIKIHSYGVRPSIVIKPELEFTGDGTKTNPYRIVGDKETGAPNDLINTRLSGEYVKLKNGDNEQVFRIIGVEDNKTKIIAMDFADNDATRVFAVDNTNGDGTLYGSGQTATQGEDTWYNYLTNTYEPNLEATYGYLFDSSTYYMGQIAYVYSYKLGICSSQAGLTKTCTKTSRVGTFNIGLPRYGEMFATWPKNSNSSLVHMFLINSFSSYNVWNVSSEGFASQSYPTNSYAARPTLHLKSTVKILSGSGTETDPYVVGL